MRTKGLKQLWSLAFGDSEEMINSFFSTAYHPDRCLFLQDGQTAAAALYWVDTEYAGRKYAYIYGVATHPDYRGKGMCRKLMEQAHRDLLLQGYAGVLLKPAGEALRQMYGKMGYRECTSIEEFVCKAGDEGTVVRTVDIPEYGMLRRRYLPEDGLIQEKENLTYLTSYAMLYAGEDFLMAAVHEEEKLFVLELLGNSSRAPGILKSMGYTEGTFRIPGDKIPFGMYHPLQEDAPVPGYLGLAFD